MLHQRRLFLSAFTGSCTLLVYLLTIAPNLSWANHGSDGGELITAAVTLGVPHPTGYPLYIILGKLISLLPVSTIAYRLNLFSAVCIALAASLVTTTSHHLITLYLPPSPKLSQRPRLPNGPEWAACAAGLTFAFAPLVWGQALISEVYGLNLLCLSLFLWALITKRPSWQTGLLLGFSITTHLTTLLMLPLLLSSTRRNQWFKLGVAVLAGLAPFLWLPYLANLGSPIIWSQPDTWQGWWWLVSGQIYQANLFALPIPAQHMRLYEWSQVLPRQFLGVGFLAVALFPLQPRLAAIRPMLLGLILRFLGTAVLYLLYAFVYATPDAIIITLPALLLCALLLGPALYSLRGGPLSLSLPLLLLLLNFHTQDLSHTNKIRPLAEEILEQAPPNTILLSADKATTFTFWYFLFAEAQRPDMLIIDTNLFAFDWHRAHLQQQYPTLFVPQTDNLPEFYNQNAARPLCHVQIKPEVNITFDCGQG